MLTVGLQSSTPEIKATDGQANVLGYGDISHLDVSVSQRAKMDNPDSNGQISMSINNASKLSMTFSNINRNTDIYRNWKLQCFSCSMKN